MESCSFPEENLILEAPLGVTAEQCQPLPVYTGLLKVEGFKEEVPAIISCWKVTKEELEEIRRTGRIWLFVYGRGMPPVALSGKNPFSKEEVK
jgi:hypothetical protein